MTILIGSPVVVDPIHYGEPVIFNALVGGDVVGQAGMWQGEGAPGTIVGADLADCYHDLNTGDIYRLDVL